MPRHARTKSKTGYYHILLRGVARQNIFENDHDRLKFLELLKRYKQELGFGLPAYCLMSNHIHLLIEDQKNVLDLIMKKLAGSYVSCCNGKYERVWHLFQDRFKSEPIDDEAYFLAVVRYIHQNPEKAKLAFTSEYRWSSYREYLGTPTLADTALVLELLNDRNGFAEFHRQEEQQPCIELEEVKRINDEKATMLILELAQVKNPFQLQELDLPERKRIIKLLKEKGLTVRQIARLTNINRGIIARS